MRFMETIKSPICNKPREKCTAIVMCNTLKKDVSTKTYEKQ